MRVAVLGAGLQGTGVALELANRGVTVDLYDRADDAMTGASVNGEGKLHLGYLYANDPTLRTAQRMVEGALAFEQTLRRWLGDGVDALPISSPFLYLVHRDSLVRPDAAAEHYRKVTAHIRDVGAGKPAYFGRDVRMQPTRVADLAAVGVSDTHIEAAFETEEIAVESAALAVALRACIAATPRIERRYRHEVIGVARGDRGLVVSARADGAATTERYNHVVNALWEGRLAIDEPLGLLPKRKWLHRYKEALRFTDVACATPSVTITLGPFGDIVNFQNGNLYLAWYPAGLRHMSGDVSPPRAKTFLAHRDADDVRARTHAALAAVSPRTRMLAGAELARAGLHGGWIFAWGDTDVDDPASGLHTRFEVGPFSTDGYHTVNTGRFTLAPLFARRLADTILGD